MFSAFNKSLFPSKLFSCPLSPIFGKHLILFVLKEMPRGFKRLLSRPTVLESKLNQFCLHIQLNPKKFNKSPFIPLLGLFMEVLDFVQLFGQAAKKACMSPYTLTHEISYQGYVVHLFVTTLSKFQIFFYFLLTCR